MPEITTPLPPACLTMAVCEWFANPSPPSRSITMHFWRHLLAAGVIRHEIDEDDPSIERIIYTLDVTPERLADEASHEEARLLHAYRNRSTVKA